MIERLPDLIKAKRREMSIQHAAKEIGISASILQGIESRKRPPSVEVFFKLLDWLDLSADYFREGK